MLTPPAPPAPGRPPERTGDHCTWAAVGPDTGHPGACGRGARYGLRTMCGAGGLANAMILESV